MSEKQEMSLGQWIGENSRVLLKLGFFTVALFSLPVITYFYTVDNVFKGKGLFFNIYKYSFKGDD